MSAPHEAIHLQGRRCGTRTLNRFADERVLDAAILEPVQAPR